MTNNIFVYSIVVLIVLVLGIWIVTLLPIPWPSIVQTLIIVLMIAAAAYAIGRKAGLWR
jgi:hypothetical protein